MSSAICRAGAVLIFALAIASQADAAGPGEPVSGKIEAPVMESPGSIANPTNVASPDLRTQALQEGWAQNAEMAALEALRKDFAVKSAEINVLKADKEITDLKSEIGIGSSQSDLPELIGIYSMPKRAWAEFLVGSAVLSASVGDSVTSEWRITKLLSNGVELSNRNGKTRTLLFGRRSSVRSGKGRALAPSYLPEALHGGIAPSTGG